jgi:hypothetical protein
MIASMKFIPNCDERNGRWGSSDVTRGKLAFFEKG